MYRSFGTAKDPITVFQRPFAIMMGAGDRKETQPADRGE
jgi:hypothetical protein